MVDKLKKPAMPLAVCGEAGLITTWR